MTERSPSVSVLVTTFNHARYVEEALESLARQSSRDFEVIITDDASTDGCAEAIEGWLVRTGFAAQFIRNAVNRGICANRNFPMTPSGTDGRIADVQSLFDSAYQAFAIASDLGVQSGLAGNAKPFDAFFAASEEVDPAATGKYIFPALAAAPVAGVPDQLSHPSDPLNGVHLIRDSLVI